MSDAALALIGALAGGSVLKIVEFWLNRGKVAQEQNKAIRDELRRDMDALKAELTKVEADLDSWREKYWELREEFSAYKSRNPDHG